MCSIAVAWCAISACGGTIEENTRGGESGSGGGEVPPVGGVSGNGGAGNSMAAGGVSGSVGAAGIAGSGGTSGGGPGGALGSGGAQCGAEVCEPLEEPPGFTEFAACCPEYWVGNPPGSICGIDMRAFSRLGYRFNPPCQRRNQRGSPDPVCPGTTFFAEGTSPSLQPGCCRTDIGLCGFQLDVVGGVEMRLGCVSSAAVPTAQPIPCGPVRPHRFFCTCTARVESFSLCAAAACDDVYAVADVCNSACAEHGSPVGFGCVPDDPSCG